MSEKQTRRVLLAATPSLDPWPIESPRTGPGVPDVFMTTCVVETKCLKKWPSKSSSPVSLHHPLTTDQYRWLNRRWRSGGCAFVLLQARRLEWILFAAPDSGPLREGYGVTKTELICQYALEYWPKGLPPDEITWWLSRSWTTLEDKRYEKFGENAAKRTGR